MGQGALSKPVIQWWLSLNSSTTVHTASGARKGCAPLGAWCLLSAVHRIFHTLPACEINHLGCGSSAVHGD